MNRRNIGATLAGFGGAAAILGLLAFFVGAADVLAAIERAQIGHVALVGTAIVAWLCLWGAGLRAVLAGVGADISAADAVLVNAGAAFANHVTPFGQAGGEPVAAWLLSDVSTADFEQALAAVTSFDTINVVPSLTLAALGLTYYASVATLDGRVRLIGLGVLVLAIVFVAALSLGWRRRAAVEAGLIRLAVPPVRVLQRILPFLSVLDADAIADRVTEFVASIERVASDRRRLAVALAFSTAGWSVQAVGLWVAFHALGAGIPAYVPLFVVPLGTVASILPTPGGLGGIETVQVALLVAATDVAPPTVAAAVAIFSVGGFFLTTTIGAGAVAALQSRERSLRLP